ncbi:MAG: hypothetical protein R3F29_10205 [Planctomycetota bacterium]
MAHRSTTRVPFLTVLGCLLAACSDGSTIENAPPRLSAVPAQTAAGAAVFTLDLSDYVSDREGATLTYTVDDGGGSFTDSTYSNTFDTMGEHEVTFTVSDGARTETGTFVVKVTSADFAVAQRDGRDLLLLDAGTLATIQVTSGSQSLQFLDTLAQGRMLYRQGSVAQLWVFDPYSRANTQLGYGLGAANYKAVTSDGKLVYVTGDSSDLTMWFYNPRTGFQRELGGGDLDTTTALVNSSDIVFHETKVDGQGDVYYYDPATDESVVVGDAATDEQLQEVLGNGACVFSRLGGGGETDLYYFRIGTGLVEVGGDNSSLDTLSKTYAGGAADGRVVFTVLNGGNEELYFWNPANGVTTAIETGVDTAVFTVTSANEVVYNVVVSGTESDAYFYDMDDATSATLRDSTDLSIISAVVDGGSKRWAIIRGSGATSDKLAVSLEATPDPQTWSAGGVVAAALVLDNGDVVALRDDGTELNVFDASVGTWGTPITGTGLAVVGAGFDAGDFIYEAEVSSQTDVLMWDASGTTTVAISDSTDDDRFEAVTAAGKVVFGRKVGANTTYDLFVWDGTTATRATTMDSDEVYHDYEVIGTYAASR